MASRWLSRVTSRIDTTPLYPYFPNSPRLGRDVQAELPDSSKMGTEKMDTEKRPRNYPVRDRSPLYPKQDAGYIKTGITP